MKEIRFLLSKIGFILLFSGLTVLQIFSFPGQFQHMRRTQGLTMLFEILLTVTVGLWILCAQLSIFCLWRIVRAMQLNLFFTVGNLLWVKRLLLTLKIASAIPVFLFLLLAPKADDPGFLVLLAIFIIFIFTLTITTSLLKDQILKKISY